MNDIILEHVLKGPRCHPEHSEGSHNMANCEILHSLQNDKFIIL